MRMIGFAALAAFALVVSSAGAQNVPLDFRFTYQGELRLANVVVDQPSDFQFSLFDQPVGGNQIGSTNSVNAVAVARGVFTVELDFGNVAFAGDRRHLEIAVRSPAGGGVFTTLTPRVEMTPAPNAHFARYSGNAFNSFLFDGLDSADFVQQAEANSVTTIMIASGAVGTTELADGSVTTAKISVGAVTNTEIAFATITGAKIANDSIGGDKITDGTIAAADLGSNSVDSSKIVDGSITAADLGAKSVTASEIATDAVGSLEIAPNAVGQSELSANSVQGSTIVDGTVTSADLAFGAIDGGDAETVDGLEAAQFLRSDVNDTLASGTTWTVTGAPGLFYNTLRFAGGSNSLILYLGTWAGDIVEVTGELLTSYNVSLGDGDDLIRARGDLVIENDVTLGDATADQIIVNGSFVDDTLLEVQDTNSNFNTAMTIHGGTSNVFTLNLGEDSNDTVNVPGFLQLGNQLDYDSAGPKRFRFENGSGGLEALFSYEPTLDSFDAGASLKVSGGTLWAGGPGGLIPLPDFHAFGTSSFPRASEVSDGDDVFITDDLALGGDLIVGTSAANSASSTIYFRDPSFSTDLHLSSHAAFIGWDEVTMPSLSACTGPTGAMASAMIFELGDGTSSGWAFTNGTDVEFLVDEIGVVAADSTINSSGGCDLAERFLGDDDLEPGTLLRADPNAAESVLPTIEAYDPATIGVVSHRPAFVMGGPTADALPVIDELMETRELLAANPDDAELVRRAEDLELAFDSWQRGNVEVALVGRVPVMVTGSVKAGEPLTSSDVSGHAMVMARAGPSIGIALESKTSAGRGMVLVLVQPGWRAPIVSDDEPEREAIASRRSDDDRVAALEERLAQVESRVVRGADGRSDASTGQTGRAGQAGRGGGSTIDRAPVPIVRLEKEAWGDVDGDGIDDVAVLSGEGLTLYRNIGDGAFQDVTARAGFGDSNEVRIALFEDYDLDRNLDLLLVDVDGVAHLLQGSGTFTFTDVTEALGLDFGQPILEARFLDHDRDGKPDLRVELADGTLLLHHNQGQGAFRTTTLRSAINEAAAVEAQVEMAEMRAQIEALTKMVEALATGATGAKR